VAFKAINELLIQLLGFKIKTRHHSIYKLLISFQTWMSDKRSLYFDPLLLEAISKLAQQMRRRLASDLKDRSIKVLSLSANKLLIDTRKKTFEPAKEYFNYLQELVSSIELYKDIDIGSEPKFWRFIMFQNSQKFSGLQHGEVLIYHQSQFDFVWKETQLLPAFFREQLLFVLSDFMVTFLEEHEKIVQQSNEEHGETYSDVIKNRNRDGELLPDIPEENKRSLPLQNHPCSCQSLEPLQRRTATT